MNKKTILVVDWLDKYGGAERVLTSLHKVFNFESCYALINIMNEKDLIKIFPEIKNVKIHQTILIKFGKKFRYLLLFFPKLINSLKIPGDVSIIISSSHAVAKGVNKSNQNQLHISYFQARNLKYIWSEYKLYFKGTSFFLYPFIFLLRKKDIKDAQKPDYIISNSNFVRDWVKQTYNIDSKVIYPPVDLSMFKLYEQKQNYYIAVGRIEPYKRFDLVIKAFNNMPEKKLKIVGDGSQLKELKKIAGSNIEFLGFLESDKVYENIKKAKGFIHAGIEDFGIAPIEAQACGTPVIAYGFGGVLETVINHKTGIFFNENNSLNLINSIKEFEKINFDYKEVRKNALKFSKDRFENEIKKFVDEKHNDFVKSKGLVC
jgi:glycosyltransferase involved in cell wall biosynthesis